MSNTYKLNKFCPVCNKKLADNNKSGYCSKHRDRTGTNNSFYGKHHSSKTISKIKNTCAIKTHELWQNNEYRQKVITNATGLKRTDEFKERQHNNALNQFKSDFQRELRSENMKNSWKSGLIVYSDKTSSNYSKEQEHFGNDLKSLLGDNSILLETKVTIKYEDKWLFPDFKFNNFIIEYNGDFWHANPKIYNSTDIIHHNITAKEIWEKDELKRKIYKNLGYELIEIWASDYKLNKQQVLEQILQRVLLC